MNALRRGVWTVALMLSTVCCGNAMGGNALREMLDAPLLVVKRPSYQGIHIYDTYYQWHPGGGIYIIENPWDPPQAHRVRAVIDPQTPETLGEGVYCDPELSWDASRLLFCFKGAEQGSTGVYEIGVDGAGLRALTRPELCASSCGRFSAQHDVGPAYLPDGRIVFTTTRPNGLVPCNNTGVDILHVMNADGSDMRRLSVNNVNEFDPCVMPDGRILHGRWEYVDKTALTQQSLWTIFPDGTNETALYANNLVRPEALLDARPVPGAPHLVAATLARHNATPRGSVAIVDTRVSKNAPAAIFNFDHPDQPDADTGDSCEPWPLNKDVLLYSGRPNGAERSVIMMADRTGRREVIFSDPAICVHSPMLVKARPLPAQICAQTEDAQEQATGRFFIQDIYRGLDGVERGEVKWVRVIEETSRVSGSPGGGGTFNQTFLVSAALAFSAKNFLGIVPVEEDGSAFFEAPAGRALYLQALDADGRLVQSMRTFVQAAPGSTRSCIGCHERKFDAPANEGIRIAHRLEPVALRPESWGSGYLDYPSMVQPVLDKHCVPCHGGEGGIAAGLDLSAGWTEFFNISYENLVSRRENQMTASLIAGIDCMNGTALWSAQRFAPRAHGSGAAPLAKVLAGGHQGRISGMTRPERDLLMAWIDTNGLYYGTWDYTPGGPQLAAWTATRDALIGIMREGGCLECHQRGDNIQFEDDWFNLRQPEWSRILRAPLPKDAPGGGLGLCREAGTNPRYKRIRLLVGGGYAHSVEPLEHYRKQGEQLRPDFSAAAPVAPFASAEDPRYQAMLAAIRRGRRDALSTPRIDMPHAILVAGEARQFLPPPLPAELPALNATVEEDGAVHLTWEESARTIGLDAALYRGFTPDFVPSPATLLAKTKGFSHTDLQPTGQTGYYALVLSSQGTESTPIRASVELPPVLPPFPPRHMEAKAGVNRIDLAWEEESAIPLHYLVYRSGEKDGPLELLTPEPTPALGYEDIAIEPGHEYAYTVRAVSRTGLTSNSLPLVSVVAPFFIREAVFTADLNGTPDAQYYGGQSATGLLKGAAQVTQSGLDLREGGYAAFDNHAEFQLSGAFSVECEVLLEEPGEMPVLVSGGAWNGPGWFLQKMGGAWRWYVGGLVCDGGRAECGRWLHLAATYDGSTARLYQDGKCVAETPGTASLDPWNGPLLIGQYSGGPGEPYQVKGMLRALKIYQRALPDQEIQAQQRPATASR